MGYNLGIDQIITWVKNCRGSMKKSIKASLISALVFPGAGHLFLKRYLTAACLASICTIALFLLISSAVENASVISDKILSGAIQPEITVIVSEIKKQVSTGRTQNTEYATTVILLVWLIAIIDAYRVGRLLERTLPERTSPERTSPEQLH